MTAGDISGRKLNKRQPTRMNQDQPREEKRRNGKGGFTAPQRRGKRASEMPGAPIKVEIAGFANANPTSRSRRVGRKKQRAEQAFMNGAGWELGVRGRITGF